MTRTLSGRLRGYRAILGSVPKLYMAYRAWFWAFLFVQVLSLTIFVFFWRAIYADRETLAGLARQQTLNYIMWGQILLPLVQSAFVFRMGQMLVDGQFAMELLRPMDAQTRYYIESFGFLLVQVVQRLPLVVFAWWVFGLQLPKDVGTWSAFLLALLLGHAVIFAFDWIFSCLAFYTTESWGLAMAQQGLATFFSGALVPLAIMPVWLQKVTLSMPFAQAIYVPASIVSGITPLSDVPRLLSIQLLWIVGLVLISRLVFRVAVRRVTVQGG